ncbi:DUF883 domain-containing protein [Shewanella morhuae]|uniref:Bacterial protein of uncharacterized function (DUF883) n=1 Tax=Shewanella morhuae TaxID=365591 RepID=A0A1N6ZH39_9GAMM|nr:DUF883 domain-containing protein [Shewanella morhuae]PTA48417.1 DUF883 domain-containing protein [Shewanella morhuae]GIU10035.1 hypothetical protein TUM4641_26280 [Shewanella morhuae]SIR26222.1 hypothetical protein SAMN05421840_11372 [Shewanella morhuae]SUI91277.1 Bacterial protein of uncharacterised function (DUF883) [Shewanella morhuae]
MASSKSTTNDANTTATVDSLVTAPVTAKATEATHHAVDAVAVKAASAEDALRKTAASSQETLAHKQEEIKQQLHDSYSKTREFAVQNPLATAGIAFAAGALLTALLRRR